jgi:hypothetical protein
MAKRHHRAWEVILGWFIANLLAVAFIGLIPYMHLAVSPSSGGRLVSSLLIGLPIGIAQWLALRRVAPISMVWVLSVSVALPLAMETLNSPVFLGAFSSLGDESVIVLTTGYCVVGLLTGLIQWVLLRGRLANAFLWPLGSAFGLGFGTGLVLVSDLVNQSGIASLVLVVLVYAIATGPLISWMHKTGADGEASLPSAA